MFNLNTDYIIQEGNIVIIDESTGRLQYGRRWSDGLHQAIEAKENLEVQKETEVLASITYQHLFLRYNKIAGMSGTAITEEVEFDQIYGLEVIEIPTNQPMIRQDLTDLIYKTEYGKWQAIAQECLDMYTLGRPVLVGTSSIEKSDLLSNLLKSRGIPHQLLNARPENIKKESQIIAQAGQKSTITIATNMAGRGTDIILGGNAAYLARLLLLDLVSQKLYSEEESPVLNSNLLQDTATVKSIDRLITKELYPLIQLDKRTLTEAELEKLILQASEKIKVDDPLLNKFREIYDIIYNNYKIPFDIQRDEVIRLGGLYVIGSERHESRRIDNQLRGRSGRQGAPG